MQTGTILLHGFWGVATTYWRQMMQTDSGDMYAWGSFLGTLSGRTELRRMHLHGDLQPGAVLQGGVERLIVAVGTAPAASAVARCALHGNDLQSVRDKRARSMSMLQHIRRMGHMANAAQEPAVELLVHLVTRFTGRLAVLGRHALVMDTSHWQLLTGKLCHNTVH